MRPDFLSVALVMTFAAGAQIQLLSKVEASGPYGPLRGSLILLAKNAPIILMIPSSGPTDRDGNSPLGIRAAPYPMLAEDLSKQGIGSVRIDKRGMFGSLRTVPDASAVTINDYVRDVGPWVDAIRAKAGGKMFGLSAIAKAVW